jgi:hemerythrin-like metal-binding protein
MMPDLPSNNTIRWLPEYAVGVQAIDQEHQGLFAIAERFHLAMRAGRGKEILECILDELVDYTCRHFAHEEKVMEQIRYPYYQDHYRQHQDLRLHVLEMKERAATGETSMTIEVMQFLMNWLKCHTTTSDRRIGTYMRKLGLVP